MLFCDEVLEATDPSLGDVPVMLAQAGYTHPYQVADADLMYLTDVLGDSSIANVVQNRCVLYSGGATACRRCSDWRN